MSKLISEGSLAPDIRQAAVHVLPRDCARLSDDELFANLHLIHEKLLIRNSLRTHTIDELLMLLRSENENERRKAVAALGELGPKAARSVKPLVELLEDRSTLVQFAAAQSLGQIAAHGVISARALLDLATASKHAFNTEVVDAACLSLAKIATVKPHFVLTRLWQESVSRKKHARKSACLSLFQIGARSPQVLLPSLHRCEASKLPALRQNAAVLRRALEKPSERAAHL